MNVMQENAWVVGNPPMIDNFDFIFSCKPVRLALGCMSIPSILDISAVLLTNVLGRTIAVLILTLTFDICPR